MNVTRRSSPLMHSFQRGAFGSKAAFLIPSGLFLPSFHTKTCRGIHTNDLMHEVQPYPGRHAIEPSLITPTYQCTRATTSPPRSLPKTPQNPIHRTVKRDTTPPLPYLAYLTVPHTTTPSLLALLLPCSTVPSDTHVLLCSPPRDKRKARNASATCSSRNIRHLQIDFPHFLGRSTSERRNPGAHSPRSPCRSGRPSRNSILVDSHTAIRSAKSSRLNLVGVGKVP
jgi:hypothetical protein